MLLFAEFILGFITGLMVSIIILVILTYFRRVIENKTILIEKMIEAKGPKPKGFIFNPPTESDEARERIILENKKKGQDTKISDLI